MTDIIFAVITVSDSCFKKEAEDTSGPCLERLIRDDFQDIEILKEIVPDDKTIIEQALCRYSDEIGAQVIFTTGGTGFSPRDVTPEATRFVVHRECPQLALAMSLESFKKTPFAALSRACCGIRNRTLIVNLPGSLKAARECFESIKLVLPHAIQLIRDDLEMVKKVHQDVQNPTRHICPHKTGTGEAGDRNSTFPMLPVRVALAVVLSTVGFNRDECTVLMDFKSTVDIPPFRASIKDGYAMKSTGLSGTKRVVGCIAAGEGIIDYDLQEDECFKINTGAPLPTSADCVVQIEDTKLLRTKKTGDEDLVDILIEPKPLLDVREVGTDLAIGSPLFPQSDFSEVVIKSLTASVGMSVGVRKPIIGIISTGTELLAVGQAEIEGRIYDSNTTMLEELLKYFGFECRKKIVLSDDFDSVKKAIYELYEDVDLLICSGGVSMGDKDYIKPVLKELDFNIHFGRVNMKPGKPMTFASNIYHKSFFGLPGNPVSAFVTFHLFVLPALRWMSGWERTKCELSVIKVILQNKEIELDSRPEYVRATMTSRNGSLYANVTGSQMSSRLQSIVGADVLLHLPGCTDSKKTVIAGDVLDASVLRYDFISKYE